MIKISRQIRIDSKLLSSNREFRMRKDILDASRLHFRAQIENQSECDNLLRNGVGVAETTLWKR